MWNYLQARTAWFTRAGTEKALVQSSSELDRLELLFDAHLLAARDSIRKSAPEDLSPFTVEIFMCTNQLTYNDAVSTAYTDTVRVIEVDDSFLKAAKILGYVLRKHHKQFMQSLAATPDQFFDVTLSGRSLIRSVTRSAAVIAEDFVCDADLISAVNLLRVLRDRPSSVGEYEADWSRLDLRPGMNPIGEMATLWLTAHEVGHHLLNHPDRSSDGNPAPGRPYLEERLTSVGGLPSRHVSNPHRKEFEADAFAFFLAIEAWGDAAATGAAGGIVCALSASAILGGTQPGNMDDTSATHPAILHRIDYQMQLLQNQFPTTPAQLAKDGAGAFLGSFAAQDLLQIIFTAQLVSCLVGQTAALAGSPARILRDE